MKSWVMGGRGEESPKSDVLLFGGSHGSWEVGGEALMFLKC